MMQRSMSIHLHCRKVAQHARALQPTAAMELLTGQAALEEAPDMLQLNTFPYMVKTVSPEDVLACVAARIQQRASTS